MFQASDTIESEYCFAQPEKNLLAAVMATAVHDLRRGKVVDFCQKHRKLALDWFKDILDAPITFKMCCEALGLSRNDVLIALREEGLLDLEEPLPVDVRSYKFLGAVRDCSLTAFL